MLLNMILVIFSTRCCQNIAAVDGGGTGVPDEFANIVRFNQEYMD